MHFIEFSTIALSYLLGSISIGYWLVQLRSGKDIRRLGSHSTGATNVGRELGRSGFALTLLGDLAKGALAVWAAVALGLAPWAVSATLIAVIAGHIWPITLRFRGGKGVATTIGALLVYDYQLLLLPLLLLPLGMFVLRSFSIAGIVALSTLPLIAIGLERPLLTILTISLLTVLLLYSHRNNIRDYIAHRKRIMEKPQ